MQKINVKYDEVFPWPPSVVNNFEIKSYQEMGFYSIWAHDMMVGVDVTASPNLVITGNSISGMGAGIKFDITEEGLEELREAFGPKCKK